MTTSDVDRQTQEARLESLRWACDTLKFAYEQQRMRKDRIHSHANIAFFLVPTLLGLAVDRMPHALAPTSLEVLRVAGVVCGVIASVHWLQLMGIASHTHVDRKLVHRVGEGMSTDALIFEMLDTKAHLEQVVMSAEGEAARMARTRGLSLYFTVVAAALIGLALVADNILQ